MKNWKVVLAAVAAAMCVDSHAEMPAPGREEFLKRQAYAEMQRVSGQIDVLQQSHDELAERVARIEGGKGELGTIRADIESLRAEIESVRREMRRMRQEIVDEMTKKVIEVVKANNAANAPRAQAVPPRQATPVPAGPCQEYVVRPGDSLFLVAQAFSTTVTKLKEMNGLKSDMIRPGQKLVVPKR